MAGDSNYPVIVFWSDEDESYVADFPDLEYCSAFGATPQEAVAEAMLALEGWLDVAQERKLALPPPTEGYALVEAVRQLRAPATS